MKKWQIQTRFYNDEWECSEECPILYDTKLDAEIELEDTINDMNYAFEMGYLSDVNAEDWRVAEVEV